jgi:hypothetical protein
LQHIGEDILFLLMRECVFHKSYLLPVSVSESGR